MFSQSIPANKLTDSKILEGFLDESIDLLHHSWITDWVGIPYVLDICIDFLGLGLNDIPDDAKYLIAAARNIALESENLYKFSPESEPKYHNRLHTAQVVTAIAIQIYIESSLIKNLDKSWASAALLLAVGHDFKHTGRVNSFESEIEINSFNCFHPILVESKVDEKWIQVIHKAMLASDFSSVKYNHLKVTGKIFSWNEDWLAVLLNESDVMASSISSHRQYLSDLLMQEWKLINFPAYKTVATHAGRQLFLKALQFTSPSSYVLNVHGRILAQLDDLHGTP